MLVKPILAFFAITCIPVVQGVINNGDTDFEMNGIVGSFTFDEDLIKKSMTVTITVHSGLTPTKQILPSGYQYYIHQSGIGPNKDCNAAGGILDPTNVGIPTPCNPMNPASCQLEDFAPEYALIGRSVVIHNNGTRIACADLTLGNLTVITTPNPAIPGSGTGPASASTTPASSSSTSSPSSSSSSSNLALIIGESIGSLVFIAVVIVGAFMYGKRVGAHQNLAPLSSAKVESAYGGAIDMMSQ
ncbi:hypothetical protein BGX26_001439 [Mortierella sp. AD094]|nr:hypothetical protein BGX26_001439 [Mortierella sp. AD094]